MSGTNAHILNPVSGLTYGFSTTATPGFVSLVVGGFAPAEWNVDDSTHNWSDPNSWTANPPNAVGAAANFLTTITAAAHRERRCSANRGRYQLQQSQ